MADIEKTGRTAHTITSPQYPDFSDEERSEKVQDINTIEGYGRPDTPDNGSFAKQNCSSCRKKKRKCDRALPTCGYCQHTKTACEYEADTTRHMSREFQRESLAAPSPDNASQDEKVDVEHKDFSHDLISSNLKHTEQAVLYPGQEFPNLTDFKQYVFSLARSQGFQPYLRRSDRRGVEIRCHSLPNPHKPRTVAFNKAGCQFRVSARTWPDERRAKADILQDVVWNTPGRWGDGTEPARVTMVQPVHICGKVDRTGTSGVNKKVPGKQTNNASRDSTGTPQSSTNDISQLSAQSHNHSDQDTNLAVPAASGKAAMAIQDGSQDDDGDTIVEESDFEEHVPVVPRKRKSPAIPEPPRNATNPDCIDSMSNPDTHHLHNSIHSNKRQKSPCTQYALNQQAQLALDLPQEVSKSQPDSDLVNETKIISASAASHPLANQEASSQSVQTYKNSVAPDSSARGCIASNSMVQSSNDIYRDSTVELGEGQEEVASNQRMDHHRQSATGAVHTTPDHDGQQVEDTVMDSHVESAMQEDGHGICESGNTTQIYTPETSFSELAPDYDTPSHDETLADNSHFNLLDPKYLKLVRRKRSLQFRYVRAILNPSSIFKSMGKSKRLPASPPIEPKFETPLESLQAENLKLERAAVEAEKTGVMDQTILVSVLQDMMEMVGSREVRKVLRIAMGEL